MNYFCVFVFVIIVTYSAISQIEGAIPCCKGTYLIHNLCENSRPVSISCDSSFKITDNFVITTINGTEYLFDNTYKFVVNSSNFCVGYTHSTYGNDKEIVLVCGTKIVEENNKDIISNLKIIYISLLKFSNIASFLTLALTAFVYFSIPQVQDTQGCCTFHFSLHLALLYALNSCSLFINIFSSLSNFCKTIVYVIGFVMLCSFTWSFLLAYSIWSDSRRNHQIDENRRKLRFRIFGYGIPCLLILISNIHVHGHRLFFDATLENNCFMHVITLMYYVLPPLLLIIILNLILYMDTLRRLWNAPAFTQNTFGKILKYRIWMNARLFFIFGISWAIFLVFLKLLLASSERNYFYYFGVFFFSIVISFQGIFIFLIMVIFRVRVRRIILQKWFTNCSVIPSRWRLVQDAEDNTECNYEFDTKQEKIEIRNNINEISENIPEV
ncbi:hypothetical protein PGB90_005070 [Kerria lacca]